MRKQHRKSFSNKLFIKQVTYLDICGLSSTLLLGKNRYFILLMTLIEKYSYICLSKSQKYLRSLRTLSLWLKQWCSKNIKMLRTNEGEEYNSEKFNDFYKFEGFMHEITIPYTSQ